MNKKEIDRRYYLKHKEKIKKRISEYYIKNKSKIAKRKKQWYLNNK